MAVAIIALSFILTMSWVISDRSKGKLEEEIQVRKVTETMLASELGSAQARSAEDALKYTALEEHLKEERQNLQKELKGKQTEREVALSTTQEMRDKLKAAEARLQAEEPVFKDDNVVRKIKGARIALAKARKSTAPGEGVAKKLDTRIKNVERMLGEAEGILEDAKTSRLATELLISQENMAALDALEGNTNWAQWVLENERRASKASMEEFQVQLSSKNQRELKRLLINLEERFISFKENKRAMEERWSDAMNALVKMDETAQSIEADLMASLESSAEYESADGTPIEALAMLRAEMETLKLAREEARTVMQEMQAAIEKSIRSESEMIIADTAQASDTLNSMILEAKFQGMEEPPVEYAELIRALNEEELEDPALLDKKLKVLNILANYLLEASGRR